jgi:hypothetical protein
LSFSDDWKEIEWTQAKHSETVRDGLTRRSLDAVAHLTKLVQNGSMPLRHGFYGLSVLYDTVSPFCSPSGKITLDQVMQGWRDALKEEDKRDAMRERQAEILTAQPTRAAKAAVEEEVAWG